MLIRLNLLFLLRALPALAQTNVPAPANLLTNLPNPSAAQFQAQTNRHQPVSPRVSETRADCIQHRRVICGKVLKVLPDGLVVDSGYTNLMRPPLNFSWVIPGTVVSQRATNLVEGNQPESVCIGLVFLTDLPKKPTPKLFDYVNLVGYPMGRHTYTSVGEVQRTVRMFSPKLAKSVQWKIEDSEKTNAPAQ